MRFLLIFVLLVSAIQPSPPRFSDIIRRIVRQGEFYKKKFQKSRFNSVDFMERLLVNQKVKAIRPYHVVLAKAHHCPIKISFLTQPIKNNRGLCQHHIHQTVAVNVQQIQQKRHLCAVCFVIDLRIDNKHRLQWKAINRGWLSSLNFVTFCVVFQHWMNFF